MQINEDLLGTIPNDIKNTKGKILWQNSNPNDSFPKSGNANTTIKLKSNDYDYLLWVCTGGNDFISPGGTFIQFKSQVNTSFSFALGQSGNKLVNVFRYIIKQSDTEFSISSCYRYTQEAGTTGFIYDNKALVPQYVIGYKLNIIA